MREKTWKALEDINSESPDLRAESANFTEIAIAEREVGVKLAEDYKEFIHRYGGAMVGPFPVFGLRNVEPMGVDDSSMPKITEFFREQHWPGVEKWAVISTDHSGNPVGLDAKGKVWISDHDAGAIQLLASNFEAYLQRSLRLAGLGDR